MYLRFAVAAATVLSLVGCAQVDGPFPGRVTADLSATPDDFANAFDFAGFGVGGDGGVGADLAGVPAPDDGGIVPVGCMNSEHVVVNEVKTAGVGIATFNQAIPGKGYLLVAATSCGCVAMADQTYGSGKLSGTAGGVAVRNA